MLATYPRLYSNAGTKLRGTTQIMMMLLFVVLYASNSDAQPNQAPHNDPNTAAGRPKHPPLPPALEYPYQPTPLDSLVAWPYTREHKLTQASLLLPGIAFELTDFIPIARDGLTTQVFLTKQIRNGVTAAENYYINFCLFRGECDKRRIKEQSRIIERYRQYGFSHMEAYAFHQALSYKIWSEYGLPHNAVVLVNPKFYNILQEKASYYGIDMQYVLTTYLSDGKYVENNEEQAPETMIQERSLDPSTFRTTIMTETLKFWGINFTVKSYPWSMARNFLQKHGVRLRSSELREWEDGSSIEHGRTCLEGMHEETLKGLVALIDAVKQETKWQGPYHLIVNGWTEKGHWLWSKILAATMKPWYIAPLSAVKSHGAGWTLDIRLHGQEAIAMKQVLAGKRGKVNITAANGEKYTIIYLYHWSKSELHLHSTFLPKNLCDEHLSWIKY